MLRGGSTTDHIFLLDDLKEHLEAIHAVGGNYVRNTMSQRACSNNGSSSGTSRRTWSCSRAARPTRPTWRRNRARGRRAAAFGVREAHADRRVSVWGM